MTNFSIKKSLKKVIIDMYKYVLNVVFVALIANCGLEPLSYEERLCKNDSFHDVVSDFGVMTTNTHYKDKLTIVEDELTYDGFFAAKCDGWYNFYQSYVVGRVPPGSYFAVILSVNDLLEEENLESDVERQLEYLKFGVIERLNGDVQSTTIVNRQTIFLNEGDVVSAHFAVLNQEINSIYKIIYREWSGSYVGAQWNN